MPGPRGAWSWGGLLPGAPGPRGVPDPRGCLVLGGLPGPGGTAWSWGGA